MKKSAGEDLDGLVDRMIKAVVLDFDGVVVNSNRLKQSAFFELFPPTTEIACAITGILSRNRGGSRFDILREILLHSGKSSSEIEILLPTYATGYNERVQQGILELGVEADVRETLVTLNRRYHSYINSGTHTPALLESVAKLEISCFFEGVYGRPPSKEDNLRDILIVEKALGREVVVVGDGEEDHESACVFGCPFIGIANEFNAWERQPFPLISSLAQLPDLLASLDA